MSKSNALRKLKRERMAARHGYTMHLLETYWCEDVRIPGFGQTYYLRKAAKAGIRRELVRP